MWKCAVSESELCYTCDCAIYEYTICESIIWEYIISVSVLCGSELSESVLCGSVLCGSVLFASVLSASILSASMLYLEMYSASVLSWSMLHLGVNYLGMYYIGEYAICKCAVRESTICECTLWEYTISRSELHYMCTPKYPHEAIFPLPLKVTEPGGVVTSLLWLNVFLCPSAASLCSPLFQPQLAMLTASIQYYKTHCNRRLRLVSGA